MRWIFWISIAIVAYVYVGYPAMLTLLARVRLRAVRRDPDYEPPVSIVIAVRNEAARLPARIQNLRRLDYRGDRQIIVVSDGSTDGPADALAPWHHLVDLIEVPAGGKAAALNAGVAAACHDIVVFADSRQTFAPDALRHLVAPFADPAVGAVTGELMLEPNHGSSVADGVGLYWNYEKWLRRSESAINSTLGATGAIYALRRSLWRPLPESTLLDDVLAPMRAVLDGFRVVFEPQALAFDQVAPDAAAEWRRKVRTLAGNYQILAQEPRLLAPGVNPVWWQYLSHKIGRLLVPHALVLLLVSSAALAHEALIYTAVLAALLSVAALAVYGWVDARLRGALRKQLLPARVAFTFVMMNYAAVAGLVALARGRQLWRS
jgi:cellulose synthase/poly-beta-1,6-N-acetylglucosamine synthase-like glycosyltransferase